MLQKKRKKKKRKASSLLHIGHKSSGWFVLFYSLPFAAPTHSCVTGRVKINMLFLVCCISGCVRHRKSEGALKRQSVRIYANVCVCVCNPGFSENVITCMSKRALVYVSKMAPVLSKSGLPADTQLQMSAAGAMCACVCAYNVFSSKLHTYNSTKDVQFPLKTNNYLRN